MNKFLVYILREPITLKPFYVGKGLKNRPYHYIQRIKCNKYPKRPVYDKVFSLYKKGLKPEIEIFKKGLTEIDAFELEKELIKKYGRRDMKTGILLNLTDGGEGTSGMKHSEEFKQKFIQRILNNKWGVGRKLSVDAKQKISLKNKGFKHSEETKRKLSELAILQNKNNPPMKNKKHSEETKLKIRMAKIGVKQTNQHKLNAKVGRKNYKHSQETRLKISNALKNYFNKEKK